MSIPRLGYACINSVLSDGPKKTRVSVNNSCIARTFREKGVEYVVGLARKNLQAVLKVLRWNEAHGIRLYRMSSDMFPHLSNPMFAKSEYDGYAYSLSQFQDLFDEIGEYARDHGHRLTFHPGQYNQIGAKDPKVFEKTCIELRMHADILDMMGCGPESIMVVHGGGVYGDKKATMERWVEQFFKLPENVQNRLVIENCERAYNYEDMLWLSERTGRPTVFDTHHHNCYNNVVRPLPDPSTFLDKIIETWTNLGLIPKFHISEQAPGKRVGAHSDYVEIIPDYFMKILDKGQDLDLMIEAKAKEQAVLYLYDTYYEFDDDFDDDGEWVAM